MVRSTLTLITTIILAGTAFVAAIAELANPTVIQAMAATNSAANTINTAMTTTTTTPIKHLIVIFQEKISFDHYFATYPYAKIRQKSLLFWLY